MAGNTEGASSKHATLFDIGLCALLIKDVEKHAVFCLRRNDNNVLEVLGTSTDERDATYVDLLDDVSLRSTTCHCLLEWIEVNDYEVDLWYLILSHLVEVALKLTTSEDASEDFWVKGLDTSTKDGWISGNILYSLTLVAERLDELLCATSGKELNALSIKFCQQLLKSVFMEHTDERCLDFFCFCHVVFVDLSCYFFFVCFAKRY